MAGELAARGYPHRLVVAGSLPPWVRPTVEALRADAPRPDRVELLGYAPTSSGSTAGPRWRW